MAGVPGSTDTSSAGVSLETRSTNASSQTQDSNAKVNVSISGSLGGDGTVSVGPQVDASFEIVKNDYVTVAGGPFLNVQAYARGKSVPASEQELTPEEKASLAAGDAYLRVDGKTATRASQVYGNAFVGGFITAASPTFLSYFSTGVTLAGGVRPQVQTDGGTSREVSYTRVSVTGGECTAQEKEDFSSPCSREAPANSSSGIADTTKVVVPLVGAASLGVSASLPHDITIGLSAGPELVYILGDDKPTVGITSAITGGMAFPVGGDGLNIRERTLTRDADTPFVFRPQDYGINPDSVTQILVNGAEVAGPNYGLQAGIMTEGSKHSIAVNYTNNGKKHRDVLNIEVVRAAPVKLDMGDLGIQPPQPLTTEIKVKGGAVTPLRNPEIAVEGQITDLSVLMITPVEDTTFTVTFPGATTPVEMFAKKGEAFTLKVPAAQIGKSGKQTVVLNIPWVGHPVVYDYPVKPGTQFDGAPAMEERSYKNNTKATPYVIVNVTQDISGAKISANGQSLPTSLFDGTLRKGTNKIRIGGGVINKLNNNVQGVAPGNYDVEVKLPNGESKSTTLVIEGGGPPPKGKKPFGRGGGR